MAGFLYPRTISISRPGATANIGAQPYGGLRRSQELPVISGVKAHIQSDRQGNAPSARLPGDAAGQSIWKIIFKRPLGTVRTGDVITSEIGDRYTVISADWGPLVTTCRCQIEQT